MRAWSSSDTLILSSPISKIRTPISLKIGAVPQHRGREIGRHAAEIHEGRLPALQEPTERLAEPLEHSLTEPRGDLIVVPLSRLPGVTDDEADRVDHHHRVRAVSARGDAQIELGIPHRHHLTAEREVTNRLVFDEEDLGLEDVAVGKRSDEMVEKGDVLGREWIATGGSAPTVGGLPLLKNTAHSSRSIVRREYVGMFPSGCL